MAIKISQLPAATATTGAELVPLVQGGVTKQTTVSALLSPSSGSSLVGFLQAGTGATPRTVQAKERDIINIKDFGAISNGSAGTDDTTAIQACLAAIAGNGGGYAYIPGVSKISAPLVLANSQSLIGQAGLSGIYNASTTTEAVTAGTNPTIFNGNASIISGLNFTGNAGGNASCHGVHINAMRTVIRDCTFISLTGSGVRGEYCQYSRIQNCGFSGNTRYGIEITNPDASHLSNDVEISDIYQNIDNGLGGIYGQMQDGLIQRCTFSSFSATYTTDAQINLIGYGMLVSNCTFELGAVMPTASAKLTATSGLGITVANSNFQSAYTNTAIAILTTSTAVTLRDNIFNYTNATTGGLGYINKADIATPVVLDNNIFGGSNPFGGGVGNPWISKHDNVQWRGTIQGSTGNVNNLASVVIITLPLTFGLYQFWMIGSATDGSISGTATLSMGAASGTVITPGLLDVGVTITIAGAVVSLYNGSGGTLGFRWGCKRIY